MPDYDILGSSAPTPAAQGDPAVWTVLGEDSKDPQGQFAVASTIANRARDAGVPYQNIVTDPKQGYEAWQDPTSRSAIQKQYPVGSPDYVRVQGLLSSLQNGTVQPLDYTHFYSPTAQAELSKKDGRPLKASFDDGTGVPIGSGNLFFNIKNKTNDPDVISSVSKNTSEPSDEIAPPVGTVKTSVDDTNIKPPIGATKGGDTQTSPIGGGTKTVDQTLSGLIRDQANPVYRNPDGSIARLIVPQSRFYPIQNFPVELQADASKIRDELSAHPGMRIEDSKNPNASAVLAWTKAHPEGTIEPQEVTTDDPKAIAAYLKSNPGDPANKGPFKPTFNQDFNTTNTSPLARGVIGTDQAVNNVFNSIEGGINAVTPGHPFRNDLATQQLNRVSNDARFNSTPYGVGKFIGETAATAPVMALPGLDAVGGESALAQGARFIGGEGGAGNVAARGFSLASKGVLQGGEQAALTSAGSDQSLGDQIKGGALTGAIAAPVFHGTGSLLSNFGVGKLSDVTRDLADKAVNKYGIDIKIPQIKAASGSTIDSAAVPKKLIAKNRQQFTSAILGDAQATPEEIAQGPTIDTINSMIDRTGDSMNRFANGRVVNGSGGNALTDQLIDVKNQIPKFEYNGTGGQALKNNIDEMLLKLKSGGLTGQDYKDLTTRGSPFYNLQNSNDGNVKFLANKVRDHLDDAFAATHNPDEPDFQWGNLADKVARDQFSADRLNFKKVMTIADAAKDKTPDGMIDPDQFTQAFNRRFTNRATLGGGSFGDLSDIGRFFLSKNRPPDTKSWILGHSPGAAVLAAGELGSYALHSPGAAIGTLGLAGLVNAGAKVLANSSTLRNRFIGNAGEIPNNLFTNRFSVPLTVEAVRQAQGQ